MNIDSTTVQSAQGVVDGVYTIIVTIISIAASITAIINRAQKKQLQKKIKDGNQ